MSLRFSRCAQPAHSTRSARPALSVLSHAVQVELDVLMVGEQAPALRQSLARGGEVRGPRRLKRPFAGALETQAGERYASALGARSRHGVGALRC